MRESAVEFTSFGDFNVCLLHPAITPYGLEVESKFQEKPCFAGGKGSRNYLTMTLQVAEGDAAALTKLDEACKAASTLPGTWCDLVTKRDIGAETRYFIKLRVMMAGYAHTAIRVDNGPLEARWEALAPKLIDHENFRKASILAAVQIDRIWAVGGKRGMTLRAEMLVIAPATKENPRQIIRRSIKSRCARTLKRSRSSVVITKLSTAATRYERARPTAVH
jgi:hypothetical protein